MSHTPYITWETVIVVVAHEWGALQNDWKMKATSCY